jgi:hypothetical protein
MRKLLLLAAGVTLSASQAIAFEEEQYRAVVAETIGMIDSGEIDVSHLVSLQEQLIQFGVEGAAEHAASNPAIAPIMEHVIANAADMPQLSLDQIEVDWHDGGSLAAVGIDIGRLDHFGKAVGLIDSVVHPATAIIALREYEATQDQMFLLQVKDELAEVIEHLAHIS